MDNYVIKLLIYLHFVLFNNFISHKFKLNQQVISKMVTLSLKQRIMLHWPNSISQSYCFNHLQAQVKTILQ